MPGFNENKSHRTYVLNDFSIVTKAMFYLITDRSTNPNQAQGGEILHVQINPEKFAIAQVYEVEPGKTDPSVADPDSAKVYNYLSKKSDVENKFDIDLRYNIYDEYKVATMDGMLAVASDISLENPKTTSCYKLRTCPPQEALFLWGDFQVYGIITSVEVTYTSFSRWGNPLSADVAVRMTTLNTPGGDHHSLPLTSPYLQLVNTKYKASSTIEKAQNYSLLGATSAYR